MKRYSFLLLLCFMFTLAIKLHSQGENNIWYFGDHAGLDFNSGSPVALSNGQLYNYEGSASICDNAGNLLFYTNGVTVWNKLHVVMPNGIGLMGNNSSTQSAIIIPFPGNPNQYYIFTIDALAGSNGMRYSIVDMTLQSGNGDVTAIKNIPLHPSTPEKVTAIQRCDGNVWVISHEWGSDRFFADLVTPSGINPSVTSNVGAVHIGGSQPNFNCAGYLKANQQGTKLALAIRDLQLFEVFDFDENTGIVSNPVSLSSPGWNVVYGVEFSPDGTKLYGELIVQAQIYQFDLTQPTAAAIVASAVIVGTCSNYVGALQLGPDNKIYVARDITSSLGYDSISVINNPNALGLACNFVSNGIYLGNGRSMVGLPNFMIRAPLPNVTVQSAGVSCFNGTNGSATANVPAGNGPFTYLWSPSGGSAATDSGLVAGTYTVQVTDTNGCTGTQTVVITQPGAIQLAMTSTGAHCLDADGTAGVTASGGTPGYTYMWNNSSPDSVINGLSAGTYSITVTDQNGCTSTSSVAVGSINSLNADAGLSTTIIEGQSTILSGSGGINYTWTPAGSLSCSNCQNPVASPSVTTTYTVFVTDSLGCQGTDTVTVFVDINCGELFVPNAFSPNGDNENDVLYVRGKCIEQMTFAIFSRWGEEVFSSTDQSKGWDGSWRGQPCETSTFMYYLKATLSDGTEVNKSGTISLIK